MYSRLALLLLAINLAAFCTGIVLMYPTDKVFVDSLEVAYQDGLSFSTTAFAGRQFHYHYENPILKGTMLLGMPALLLQAVVMIPITDECNRHFGLSLFWSTYIDAAAAILATSLQWYLIGILIDKRVSKREVLPKIVQYLNKRFMYIALFLGLWVILVLPLLNYAVMKRYYAVGWRPHGVPRIVTAP
jgi:hypothetical protein